MGCKPKMAGCGADCLHRAFVEDYRLARQSEEMRAEGDRDAAPPSITFKQWLEGHAYRSV